jgi:hypothetical protein
MGCPFSAAIISERYPTTIRTITRMEKTAAPQNMNAPIIANI